MFLKLLILSKNARTGPLKIKLITKAKICLPSRTQPLEAFVTLTVEQYFHCKDLKGKD